MDHPVHSCEWNRESTDYVYCGQNGAVLVFDIRKPDKYIMKYKGTHPVPIHSINYVSPTHTMTSSLHNKGNFNGKGILTGNYG